MLENAEKMKATCRIWCFALIGSALVAAVITVWCLIKGAPIIGELEGMEFTWGLIAMTAAAIGCAVQAVIGFRAAKGHYVSVWLCSLFGLIVFIGVMMGAPRMLGQGWQEFIAFLVMLVPSIAVNEYNRQIRKAGG